MEAPHEPKALALPPLRVPRRGELTVRLDAFTSSALGSTARRQGARMRLCQSLLSVCSCRKHMNLPAVGATSACWISRCNGSTSSDGSAVASAMREQQSHEASR